MRREPCIPEACRKGKDEAPPRQPKNRYSKPPDVYRLEHPLWLSQQPHELPDGSQDRSRSHPARFENLVPSLENRSDLKTQYSHQATSDPDRRFDTSALRAPEQMGLAKNIETSIPPDSNIPGLHRHPQCKARLLHR